MNGSTLNIFIASSIVEFADVRDDIENFLWRLRAERGLDVSVPQEGIVHGDAVSYSIAAASIVAKVTRDRMMLELDAQYPQYGFAQHKGYGTQAHYEALRAYGPCPAHRRLFIRSAFAPK